MIEGDFKNSFDRLVAGLNAEDRLAMLNRINQAGTPIAQLTPEAVDPDVTVSLKKKA